MKKPGPVPVLSKTEIGVLPRAAAVEHFETRWANIRKRILELPPAEQVLLAEDLRAAGLADMANAVADHVAASGAR